MQLGRGAGVRPVGGAARGERDDHVRGLVRELTGTEDACRRQQQCRHAVLLVLSISGPRKEAVVSRGD
jgi:L-seryl-tRNA(Ser) seleniumtransferase